MLTVGDLFSGIGGISLGLERTGGFRTIWFCEIDAYANAVLKKHWSEVPNIGDIRKVDWDGIEKPDVLCGGFPCQDISIAGKRKGITKETRSGLWFEFAKAIRILRPRYALIENVAMLANNGLSIVLADLAQAGYDAEWGTIRASDVGANHRRERLFIIAYPDGERCSAGSDNTKNRQIMVPEIGQPEKNDKNGEGRKFGFNAVYESHVADNRSKRIQRVWKGQVREFPEFSWCKDVRRVEDLRGRQDIPEPLIRGSHNGVSDRVDRTKCLGNAVVPQVAQTIGEWILEYEG